MGRAMNLRANLRARPAVTFDEGSDATHLLRAWRAGQTAALEPLSKLIYRELRQRARMSLQREPVGHSLQGTELAHEAFLRLMGCDVSWQDRAHFLAVAARSMRRILIDHARRRRRLKRGAGRPAETLDEASPVPHLVGTSREDLLALDAALEALAQRDATKAHLVELAFFVGMTVREISEVVGRPKSSVQRELTFAKAWLHRRLS